VKVIAGLGNPGEEYRETRHNAGFLVIGSLARESGIALAAGRGDFLSGSGRIAGRLVHLLLPLSYMNASGPPIAEFLDRKGLGPSELLVVCDDANLPPGRIRLRPSGSDGGHNGLASIIERLGTEEFARLRLGIGGPPPGVDLTEHVLGRFRADERPLVDEMVARAAGAVKVFLAAGIERAMGECNAWSGEELGSEP
jgi:PTH1 family peptidyl-tRNA hydrolase